MRRCWCIVGGKKPYENAFKKGRNGKQKPKKNSGAGTEAIVKRVVEFGVWKESD